MNTRKFVSSIVFVLVGVGLVTVPAPTANAATTEWFYSASTGATYAHVISDTVSSDLTAQTSISGGPSSTAKNSTAGVDGGTLLKVGAAETRTTATKLDGAITMDSFARTAGVNLLNGLITVDAVETNIKSVGSASGQVTVTGGTQLLGIKIVGVNLPVEIPKNYAVNIPGVASVNLNMVVSTAKDGRTSTRGWGLAVQLLKDRDGKKAGTTIAINPVGHDLEQIVPTPQARLGGFSFSSRVQANVSGALKVVSDPTAYIGTPSAGSNGTTIRNSTATATLPPGLGSLGTLVSTTTSTRDAVGNAQIVNTNSTAALNLLGGLITADAIDVTATGKLQDGKWTGSLKMTTLNLVIAGQKLPVDIAPNTAINVAGLGKVELNKQATWVGGGVNRIDGLKITLDTSRAGLPVGAVIEFSIAATQITPAGA